MSIIVLLSFLSFFEPQTHAEVDDLHSDIYQLLDENLPAARELAEVTLKKSKDIDYKFGEANSLYIIAYCDDRQNKLNKAVPEYLQALEKFTEIEGELSIENQAEIHLNLGRIFKLHYKYQDAISFYNRGLSLAEEINNLKLKKKLLHNLSIAYKHKGDLVKAAEIQFEKLGLLGESDRRDEIKSYNQIGLINIELQEFEEARSYFEHIIKLEKDKKTSKYRAMAFHNIADAYMKENNYGEAKKSYLSSLSENLTIKNKKDIFLTYLDLTQLHLEINDFESAEKYGLKASVLLSEVPKTVEYNRVNHYLSQIYFHKDELHEAKIYFDRYVTQMESLYDQQKELASQGDQYKIELITSTYFAKIQEQEKINYYMVGVAGLVAFFILFLIYNRYRKVAAAKMLREHFSSISFNISNTSSSK